MGKTTLFPKSEIYNAMEEIWKSFEPPFDGYKISNFGRLLNPKGKELKIAIRKDRGYYYPLVSITLYNGGAIICRKHASLAQEVYKAFGEGYKDGAKVFAKDGDVFNCRIDNLTISKIYTEKPTAEQVAKYEKEVTQCVLHYVKVREWNDFMKIGLDVDNIIGNAYADIYQYLPKYNVNTSFYAFCKTFCDYAFLHEYKKFKKEQEHTIRLTYDM